MDAGLFLHLIWLEALAGPGLREWLHSAHQPALFPEKNITQNPIHLIVNKEDDLPAADSDNEPHHHQRFHRF
jgi:hypothetical protein